MSLETCKDFKDFLQDWSYPLTQYDRVCLILCMQLLWLKDTLMVKRLWHFFLNTSSFKTQTCQFPCPFQMEVAPWAGSKQLELVLVCNICLTGNLKCHTCSLCTLYRKTCGAIMDETSLKIKLASFHCKVAQNFTTPLMIFPTFWINFINYSSI